MFLIATLPSSVGTDGGVLLSGDILFDGNQNDLAVGFIVGQNIDLIEHEVLLTSIYTAHEEEEEEQGHENSSVFESLASNLISDTTYYFRAFATYADGESHAFGSLRRFVTPPLATSFEWKAGLVSVGGGWFESPWFGTLFMDPMMSSGWVFQDDLEWIFVHSDETGGIWLWSAQNGWLWTREGVWPFLYSHQSYNWLYFLMNRDGELIFYDYSLEQYTSPNEGLPSSNQDGIQSSDSNFNTDPDSPYEIDGAYPSSGEFDALSPNQEMDPGTNSHHDLEQEISPAESIDVPSTDDALYYISSPYSSADGSYEINGQGGSQFIGQEIEYISPPPY